MAVERDGFTSSITTDKESSPWWEKDVASKLLAETKDMLVKYTGVLEHKLVEHIDNALHITRHLVE